MWGEIFSVPKVDVDINFPDCIKQEVIRLQHEREGSICVGLGNSVLYSEPSGQQSVLGNI